MECIGKLIEGACVSYFRKRVFLFSFIPSYHIYFSFSLMYVVFFLNEKKVFEVFLFDDARIS